MQVQFETAADLLIKTLNRRLITLIEKKLVKIKKLSQDNYNHNPNPNPNPGTPTITLISVENKHAENLGKDSECSSNDRPNLAANGNSKEGSTVGSNVRDASVVVVGDNSKTLGGSGGHGGDGALVKSGVGVGVLNANDRPNPENLLDILTGKNDENEKNEMKFLFRSFLLIAHFSADTLVSSLLDWRIGRMERMTTEVGNSEDGLAIENERHKLLLDYMFAKLVLKLLKNLKAPLSDKVNEHLEEYSFRYVGENSIVMDTSLKTKTDPDLVNCRNLCFMLVSEILSCLSATRFSSVSGKLLEVIAEGFSSGVDLKCIATITANHSILMDISNSEALGCAFVFVETLEKNYFSAKMKKPKLIQMKLMTLLGSVLMNVILQRDSDSDDKYKVWNQLLIITNQKLELWAKKNKKREAFAQSYFYLKTALLCCGNFHYFDDYLNELLLKLFKLQTGGMLTKVSAECFFRILVALLKRPDASDRFQQLSEKISSSIFNSKTSKSISLSLQNTIVDIIRLIAIFSLKFAGFNIIVSTLEKPSSTKDERSIICFRAFNLIMEKFTAKNPNLPPPLKDDSRYVYDVETIGFLGSKFRKKCLEELSEMRNTDMDDAPEGANGSEVLSDILYSLNNSVSKSLDIFLDHLNPILGHYLLMDSKFKNKTWEDISSKFSGVELQSVKLLHVCLETLKYCLPKTMHIDYLILRLLKYTMHLDPVIRKLSTIVLKNFMGKIRTQRVFIVHQYSKFISSIPHTFPTLISSAVDNLIELLELWLILDSYETDLNHDHYITDVDFENYGGSFAAIEGLGIGMMCSALPQLRWRAFILIDLANKLSMMTCKEDIKNSILSEVCEISNHKFESIVQSPNLHKHVFLIMAELEFQFQEMNVQAEWQKISHKHKVLSRLPDALINTMNATHLADQEKWSRWVGWVVEESLSRGGSEFVVIAYKHACSSLAKMKGMMEPEKPGKSTIKGFVTVLDNAGRIEWRNHCIVGCVGIGLSDQCEEKTEKPKYLFKCLAPPLKFNDAFLIHALLMGVQHLGSGRYLNNFKALEEHNKTVYKKHTRSTRGTLMYLRLALALIYKNVSDFMGDGHFFSEGEFKPLLHTYLEWINETKSYLLRVMEENTLLVQELRLAFMKIVRNVFNELKQSGDDVFQKFIPKELRRDTFLFLCPYCGHTPSSLKVLVSDLMSASTPTRSTLRGKIKAVGGGSSSTQPIQFYDNIPKVDNSYEIKIQALKTMQSCLFGGWFLDMEEVQDKTGPIFQWVSDMFTSDDEKIINIGDSAMSTYLFNNPMHDDYLFSVCVDLCFDPDKQVRVGYFKAVSNIILARPICFQLSTTLHLCIVNLLDNDPTVRKLVLKVLRHITDDNYFSSFINPGIFDSRAILQVELTKKLVEIYPEIGVDMISVAWSRMSVMQDIQILDHLNYLGYWTTYIDLTKEETKAQLELLQNLSLITAWFEDRKKLVGNIWKCLVSKNSQNLNIILDFITMHAVITRNNKFIDVGKRIVYFISEVLAEEVVKNLISGLDDTILIKEDTGKEKQQQQKKKTPKRGSQIIFSQILDNTSAELKVANAENAADDSGENAGGSGDEEKISSRKSRRFPASPSSLSRGSVIKDDKGKAIIEPEETEEMEEIDRRWNRVQLLGVDKTATLPYCQADIRLLLITDLYHIWELFIPSLDVVIHSIFLQLDSNNTITCTSAKKLLYNILHSIITAKGEDGKVDWESTSGEFLQQLEDLKDQPWPNEDPELGNLTIESSTQIESWVLKVINIFQENDHFLLHSWPTQAISWVSRIGRVQPHFIYRSLQIYRSLIKVGGLVDGDAVQSLLVVLYKHLVRRPPHRIGLCIDILNVALEIIRHTEIEELLKFPELFWCTVALLPSDYHDEFNYGVRVVLEFLKKLEENVEVSQCADFLQTFDDFIPSSWAIDFHGVNPLILKGLMSPKTSHCSLEVFQYFVSLPEESSLIPLFVSNSKIHPTTHSFYLYPMIGTMGSTLAAIEVGNAEATKFCFDFSERFTELDQPNLANVFATLHKCGESGGVGFSDKFGEICTEWSKAIAHLFFPDLLIPILNLLILTIQTGEKIPQGYNLSLLCGLLKNISDWKTKDMMSSSTIAMFMSAFECIDYENLHLATDIFLLLPSNLPIKSDISVSEHVNVSEQINLMKKGPRVFNRNDKGKPVVCNAVYQVMKKTPRLGNTKLPKPPKIRKPTYDFK
eukprot:CAMPEP_0174259622 /NCGR_PEP_ID=MMETSP0439-20130205/8428_1 /TAXON_ID=0 /ORGANISM="Stereomyxa ramosa, Strain Chinc5" /LENGTH=2204 /DNA_ID=CAMNT_0015343587 /DNA_START=107 /DNA_END=6718 /DNA_ORIENTATION=+